MQISLLAGQNAGPTKTSTSPPALSTSSRASGAALFGAILTAQLGDSPSATTTVNAFQTLFFWTIPFMSVALIASLAMKEMPLSEEMMDVVEGKLEVPEY